jgi:hypothetical protein
MQIPILTALLCGLALFLTETVTTISRPPSAPPPQRIINYGGGWKDGQVNEPCILVNPKDPTKLIMFFSGMQLGGTRGAIGKAWANIDEPLIWHEDPANPIMTANPAISFEASAIRLDTVIYQGERDEYWIYYTGSNFKTQADAIGLAITPTGKRRLYRCHASQSEAQS